jgi:hypothetical protein
MGATVLEEHFGLVVEPLFLSWLLGIPESAPFRADDFAAVGPPEVDFLVSEGIEVLDFPLSFIGQAEDYSHGGCSFMMCRWENVGCLLATC